MKDAEYIQFEKRKTVEGPLHFSLEIMGFFVIVGDIC